MNTTEHGIEESRAVENMYHMRLMALLQELVRKRGPKGAARVLEIDPKTVAESIRTGRLSRRTRDSLERATARATRSSASRATLRSSGRFKPPTVARSQMTSNRRLRRSDSQPTRLWCSPGSASRFTPGSEDLVP